MDCEIDLSSPATEDALTSRSVGDSGEFEAGSGWTRVEPASRPGAVDRLPRRLEELLRRYETCLIAAPASLAALIFARHRQELAAIIATVEASSTGGFDGAFAASPAINPVSDGPVSNVWQSAAKFIAGLEDMLELHRDIMQLASGGTAGRAEIEGEDQVGIGWAALALSADVTARLTATMQLHIWDLNRLLADTRAKAEHFPHASEAMLGGQQCHLSPEDSPVPANSGKGGLSAWQLRRIESLVEAEPGRQISVPRLAEAVGLSVSHFTRAFKASTGEPPAHWLLLKRLDRAKRLLVESEAPLAQIAETCGFAEQSHFSKRFRQVTGMTPGDWRRRYK
jgi:AraC-like DNA-binding protein